MEQKDNNLKNNTEVFKKEPHVSNKIVHFFITCWEYIFKLIYWIYDLVLSMFLSIWHFIKLVGKGCAKGFKGFINFFKRKAHQFRYNDTSGKVSFFVFGVSSFKHKQYVNGVLYIIFEVCYIVLLSLFGANSMFMLGTLGTVSPGPDPSCSDDFCDWVNGDNSIMILIYGLLWVLSIIFFLYIWNRNINASYTNYRIDNFKKFEKITSDNLNYGIELDNQATTAFNNGISLKDFKKENIPLIKEKLKNIENELEKNYSYYLLSNNLSYSYIYLKKLKQLNLKKDKIQTKVNNTISKLESDYQLLLDDVNQLKEIYQDDEEVLDKLNVKQEKALNKKDSKIRELNRKIKKQEHIIFEYIKTHTNFVSMQHISNNKKYEKFNDYYNIVSKYKNEINFLNNFSQLVHIYNESLANYEKANEDNKVKLFKLEESTNVKIENTKTKFTEIRSNRTKLEVELHNVNQTYKENVSLAKQEYKNSKNAIQQEINKNKDDIDLKLKLEDDLMNLKLEYETKLLDIKANQVDEVTRINRLLHDLPSLKNVKALEKEEIKESKNAYNRDKRYIRTNYDAISYAKEMVINKIIVDYKTDYKNANYYFNKYFILKKNKETKVKELVCLTDDELTNLVDNLNYELQEFENEHQDKYLGKAKTFKESVGGLLNENFHITILTVPIVGILLFSIIPLIFSMLVAFTNYSVGHIPPTQLFTWVGWENFANLLFPSSDSQFKALPNALLQTVGWTFLWALAATFTNYILGIIVALLINKKGIKLKRLWRTIFVLTIAIPQFISLLSISTLLKDTGALGRLYLEWFGVKLGFGTTNAVAMTKFIIILVNIWVGIPYTILSTTGILLNIPKDLYESAKVDGAGTITQFSKITMPYILFVTGPYLITQFIGNINNFNVIYFLTGGGPTITGSSLLGLGQTDLLITFLYKIITSTNNAQYGIASSVGIIIFIICSFVSIVMYNKSGAIKEEDQFQ